MKKLLFIIILIFSMPIQAEIQDDKVQHFVVGGVIYAGARVAGFNEWQSFGAAFAAGIIKEIYDSKHEDHTSDTKDALATALGGASLMVIEWHF